jgi:hypothetical protein
MRPTVWLSLVALALIAAGCAVQAPAADATRVSGPVADRLPAWTVESGWMATRDDAVLDALEKAQKHLGDHLQQQTPPVEWRPSKEYVRDRLLKDVRKDEPGVAEAEARVTAMTVAGRQAREEVKNFGEGVGPMHRVWLRVEVSPRDRDDMYQQEQLFQEQQRQVRATERQMILAKALAGFVAVLAAVAGYLRLEDATKGYYTTLLRLGAVTFLGLVGAAIWLIS